MSSNTAMHRVDELDVPPTVGETYLVPCVYGLGSLGTLKSLYWWPVLLPSHEDSRYNTKIERNWVETDEGRFSLIEKRVYVENSDPKTKHHYHVDARFVPENWYEYQIPTRNLHGVVFPPEDKVEYKPYQCLREMPAQTELYRVFGIRFVEDYTGKKIKCGRCPHKGVNLLTAGTIVGDTIVCPSHGMKFDKNTGKAIF